MPIQQTTFRILAEQVESKIGKIKEWAPEFGAEIQQSNFQHAPDGSELGSFAFRLPMSRYPAFVERLKELGKMKDFTVARQDRPNEKTDDANAVAEIGFQIYSPAGIMAEDTGFVSSIRRTLTQGWEALFWSIRMIAAAVAWLLPWAMVLAILGWVGIRIARRSKKGKEPEVKSDR